MISRDRILAALLLALALVFAVVVVLAAISGKSTAVVVAFTLWAALALAWFGLRARTGLQVRQELDAGAIDRRLGGIGTKHYAWILMLAVVVALLSWLVVRSSQVVAALGVVGILRCALAISLIRSYGYRRRQETIVKVTR